MLLERHVDIFGHESRRVLEFACLNSFFQSGMRNLLDEAVLTHAELHSDIRSGVGYVKVDEIPFDFERRRMSVVVGTADALEALPDLQGCGRGGHRRLRRTPTERRQRADRAGSRGRAARW